MIASQRVKVLLTAFVFSLLLHGLHGSNPIDRTFFSVNEIHGVSLRMANSVIEDDLGFIWVSSKTGVLRLTEDDHRSYLLPYKTPDVITVKLVFGTQELIAYSNNGQFYNYNKLSDQFEFYFDLRPMLGTNRISVFNVLLDQDGILYIPTSHGLFSYTNDNQLVSLTPMHQSVRHLAWYDHNHLFVSRDDGILIITTNGEEKEFIPFKDFSGPLTVTTLFYDKGEERLWIGAQSGHLLYLNIGEKVIKKVELKELPRQPILAIKANTENTIMLGYDGQGLWEINRAGNQVLNVYREDVNNPSSLRGNGVYDIFRDSNERVWVCTYSGGVSFFEQSTVDVTQIRHITNNPNSLVNNAVNDIFEDSDGNIWFATNNGISRWQVATNKWDSYLNSETGDARVVLSIFGDSEGKIWAGTWSAGIFVLDAKTGKKLDHYFYPGEVDPAIGNNIFDITEDSQGDLWIVGVVEQILRFSRKENKLYRYGNEPVYVIKELNEDEMLMGCSFGLVLLNKHTGSQEIILDGYIINDFLVRDHEIWCVTSGGGLIRLDLNARSYQQFTIESGLLSNFVNSIYYVDDYIWVGTENGLCRFSPETNEVLNYSSIIQLASVSFNPGAVQHLRNGQLIFGTNQGAVLFNPNTLEPHKNEGHLFIQDIVISGRTIRDSNVFDLTVPVNSLDLLNLTYNQRTVSLELLPKGLSAPGSKISWKFDGLGDVWSEPSSNRILTFANLPSGTYELQIRMYNNSLSQVIDERNILVRVNYPFWETWWFYMIIIIVAAGILYFTLRYQISLIQKRHSEEKVEFFANTAHEIRTALTLIGGPVEEIKKEVNLSERGRYYLSLATDQVNNLLKIATQLLDFQKFDKGKEELRLEVVNIVELIKQRISMFESYAQNNNVKLSFQSEVEIGMTAIDIDKMAKVFDNLISNAIKYSHKGGEVGLCFFNDKSSWVLTVKDQGIGIGLNGQRQLFKEFYRSENAINSKTMGSGIGLLMVRNYVESHNGKVSFRSKENVGSTFKIEIPYVGEIEKYPINNLYFHDVVKQEIQLKKLLKIGSFNEKAKTCDIHILLVEDNDNLRGFMKVALGSEFKVSSAANGKEAWEIVRRELPDLVISDIMMPEMNGFELCRLMKSTYETSHIAVILLTALTEKVHQLQGIGLGADAYLTKPFDMTLLVSRINSIISNRKLIKEKALKLFDRLPDEPLMDNELNDQFVKKAFEVARSNISNSEFGKDKFASEMNVSSSLLYKKIKSLTDQSPTDFIKSIRLKEAVELLKCKKYTITEVSEMCGFASVGYFSTVFKKYYRKTPSEILEEIY
jgi:signal transduction histidine kinase/CheY-like chemotaxis protein/ligand-binding sensor domain-containing protein